MVNFFAFADLLSRLQGTEALFVLYLLSKVEDKRHKDTPSLPLFTLSSTVGV